MKGTEHRNIDWYQALGFATVATLIRIKLQPPQCFYTDSIPSIVCPPPHTVQLTLRSGHKSPAELGRLRPVLWECVL
ncbi:hypothetical protein CHH28_05655 [Bacterioplanes sanyensis]|uniref:Uncharacterized protein n=1 Tax=Bacterioplanes sanyensis TaxID=1249553 RepID=A0A222FHG4_9GAMM|nr:hypothetical protein CHH28_05655 [Bacterioplanes sanyensis]